MQLERESSRRNPYPRSEETEAGHVSPESLDSHAHLAGPGTLPSVAWNLEGRGPHRLVKIGTGKHNRTAQGMRAMRYKLRGVGAGPHAIYCRNGQRAYDAPLPEGAEVKDASEADKAQVPADLERLAGDDERGVNISYAGIFVVPGKGVAAIYGCVPVPVEEEPED